MDQPHVTTVRFEEYETGIKTTWLEGYLEWAREGLEQWIEDELERGNDDFIALAATDWDSALDAMYQNDVQKFENDTVTIIGVIDDASFVGGIYLDILDELSAKINRLWLPEEYRGHGLGKELAKRAVSIADEQMVDRIRLSTGPFMQSAQFIYRDLGFEYRDDPYPSSTAPEPLHPYWNFMELEL